MKILGLDLGTNSIGWAVVDKENCKILDTGVRIFPEGVVKETIGKGDKEQSKNATRREHRQMRRQFYRKRLRKIKLLNVLIEQKMCPLTIEELNKWKNWDKRKKSEGRKFPDSPEFSKWLKMNPYILRSKAVKEKITLYELGRIFYHIIQRRGFLSSRKGKEDTTIYTKGKPDENILSINETKENIGTGTLGEYLYSISCKDGEQYKVIKDETGRVIRVRGRYTVRDMYIEEFERIWKVQLAYHDIDSRIVKSKKIRELKGSLTGKRNQQKINYLKEKYGSDNVEIDSQKKGVYKVISTEKTTLKELLAGKIYYESNDNARSRIQFNSNNSVLFWQRPLRSQKGLLSNCRFEDNLPVIKRNGEFLHKSNGEIQTRSKKPCPLSHPEYELFRAYQFINNIRYGKNRELTTIQKGLVLDLINRKDKNFDFKEIPELLKMSYEKFNYDDKQKVAGNSTIKQLKPIFDKEIWDKYYEQIWHCFYFYEDTDHLFQKLKHDYGFKKDIEVIRKVKLKEGYSNVSIKAIRNILPFLEKGYQYDKAAILGGVKNAFGDRWRYFKDFHDIIEKEVVSIIKEQNKEGKAILKIKEYLSLPTADFGFEKDDPHFLHLYHHSQEIEKEEGTKSEVPEVENLRNPIVQQGLYEVRRLINTLMEKYSKELNDDFHFDQIKIEMGRDLRNSKDGRQEMSFRIRENENKNVEARERIAEYGLQPSRDNIQKFLMFREIEEKAGKVQCPYTGKIISIADLLGRENVIQIEHIIPFSISLDDSFGNKTLCEANFNREKGEKTPYGFYLENPDPKLWGVSSWNAIEERAFHLLPYRKAKKFSVKREFEKSDFIQRQLNDSRYIAKKTVELLSHVCNDVRVMPGQLTAELRHLWGLNNILQPVQDITKANFEIDEDNSIPYYVIANKDGDLLSAQRKQNPKPETDTNEILITGNIDKGTFNYRLCKLILETPDLPNGKYWAKLQVNDIIQIVPKYIDRPQTDNASIVFKGKVQNGLFKNETYGRLKTNVEDGSYWAEFQILKTRVEEPVKGKHPKISRNQVLLFGEISNGIFKSYIYECETNLPDGKYWIILDLDKDNVDFIRTENPKPEISDNQLLINATIKETGKLVADVDPDYQIETDKKPGKYYIVLDIMADNQEFYKVENEAPKPESDQVIIEGNIWVDKYTGEIKFDPKKNRDDHRHHAIDAITIALTEQGYLQRLSTYNAQRKAKLRQKLDSTEKFPEPWNGFDKDVKNAINSILISHRKSNKTLTKNRKGFSVRGQLHDDTYYGKKTYCFEKEYTSRISIKKLKFKRTKGQAAHIDDVIDKGVKNAIYNTIIDKLKNTDDREILKEILIRSKNTNKFKTQFDRNQENKKINELRGIINSKVENIIQEESFFLPNEGKRFRRKYKCDSSKERNPVPIKKVKVKRVMGSAVLLKELTSFSSKENREKKGKQIVNPGNNHHILVYYDHNGNLKEVVVQFWIAVERILQGENIYKLPEDGKSIVTTLEINDMFLLGLSDEEFSSNRNNLAFLSNYLYRVQKFTSGDYYFRKHTASTINNPNEKQQINSFGYGKNGWLTHNPIKVKVDTLGNLLKI